MNQGALDLAIIAPAFLAGLLVLLTHVPLGAQVLRRGIVFIDLAIAQVAALGVILASMAELEQAWMTQLSAAAAALLGALLLTWTEKRWPEVQEALIGALFVLAATGSMLLLAHNPHGGEHLRDLLGGQILWVGYQQLLLPTLVSLLLALVLALRPQLARAGFYLLFALAVTISVQLVGVYLVFASLILPALAVRQHPERRRLPLAWLLGMAGYGSGLLLSLRFDLPSGALIVWCLAALAILVHATAPRRGA